MDKRKILLKIKEKFGFKSDADFARYIGISPQNLSNWYARQSFDENLLLVKFTNINKQWLLTGEGSILNDEINAVNYGSEILKGKELPYVINTEMIPDAAAGYQFMPVAIAASSDKSIFFLIEFQLKMGKCG